VGNAVRVSFMVGVVRGNPRHVPMGKGAGCGRRVECLYEGVRAPA